MDMGISKFIPMTPTPASLLQSSCVKGGQRCTHGKRLRVDAVLDHAYAVRELLAGEIDVLELGVSICLIQDEYSCAVVG